MSEPANVIVLNEYGDCLTNIEIRHGGNPGWLGQQLFLFLKNRKICNGYNSDHDWTAYSNGMENLAAQLSFFLMGLNDGRIGGVYFRPTPPDLGFDWIADPYKLIPLYHEPKLGIEHGNFLYIIYPSNAQYFEPDKATEQFLNNCERDIQTVSMGIIGTEKSLIGDLCFHEQFLPQYPGWDPNLTMAELIEEIRTNLDQ